MHPEDTDGGRGSGEFARIQEIMARVRPGPGVQAGIGDDAAVITPSAHPIVVTCDALIEDVHFRTRWIAPEALGRKAVAVNISDLAAMGAEPRWALLAIATSPETPVDWFRAVHEGVILGCEAHDITLVGGDVTSSPGPAMLTITLLGESPSPPLLRSGGRPGHLVWVTGTLGDSGLGLRLLEAGEPVTDPARRLLVERHHAPTPRLAWGRRLAQERWATACADISDGLLQDLGHVARQSGCAAEVDLRRVPRSLAHQEISRELGLEDPVRQALTDGEDYELVFTTTAEAPIPSEVGGVPATAIGRLVEGPPGEVCVVDGQGQRAPVTGGGWTHFQGSSLGWGPDQRGETRSHSLVDVEFDLFAGA